MPTLAPLSRLTFLTFFFAVVFSSCKKDSDNSNPSTTNPDLATITADRVDSITYTSAKIISTVSKEGKSAVVGMGIAWGKNPNPTVVADNKIAYPSFGVGTFGITITGLEIGATYYVRSYATNAIGTAYSEQKTFTTTGAAVPVLTTTTISDVFPISAKSGGTITAVGSSPVTERGIVWSTTTGPTIASPGKQKDSLHTGSSFPLHLYGLSPSTQYYVRAYATNAQGTGYGNEVTFTTLNGIVDADGNLYHSVTIGTQTWLRENLKTSKYRNGDPIPNLADSVQWEGTTSGAWCVYKNNPSNSDVYGKLYNFLTVEDTRGLCPVGYHVPAIEEWNTLVDFLGGPSVAGGKLKDVSSLWESPNTHATNESGFSALPAGYRGSSYALLGTNANWWSSTRKNSILATFIYLQYNSGASVKLDLSTNSGFGVRCIKD